MNPTAALFHKDILTYANPRRAAGVAKFFQTGKGQYGEGDQFLGLTVPQVRQVAKPYRDMPLDQLAILLASPWHEERLGALVILSQRAKVSKTPAERKKIATFYLKNISGINNWDLVDVSAEYCIGMHLADLDPAVQQKFLKKRIQSRNVWERRIAMVATCYFSRKRISDLPLWVAEQLIGDTHDLIHKASGWMLREFGKRASEPALVRFLKEHYQTMPRTMLRYAIERLEPETRAYFMRKTPPNPL